MNTYRAKRSSILRMTIAMVLLLCAVCGLLVSCKPEPEDTTVTTAPAPAGPEGGTYYYDTGVEEYTLTLSDGKQFTLSVKGKTAKGSYSLANGKLTLDFAEEGKANVIATYENNTVTLTYEGATMRFYKKINYTVSFVTNGASDIKAQTVLNGKTATKPADPVRPNFVFIGWYLDSSFKTPFTFARPITGDITLYARWIEKVEGAVEYTVSFDANYEHAQHPADRPTVGGKLYGLPVLERAGYVFMGWWISMSESGDKLSYQYEEGTAIKEDITLYAMWQKIPAGDEISVPVVRIAANSISWNSVKGARSYKLIVTNQDGVAVIEQETPATAVNVSFAALDAGEYQIKVIAYANAGEEYNAETTLYYSNKQLDKVTEFTVAGSWLSFEGVANAEKYLISVVCGNPDHQHTALDNGASTTFNFANCKMTKDGIRFTVTAVAEGYISSTSREYLHLLLLDGVEGLHYDEATQEVRWNAVPHAEYYMVSVKCGNPAHSHEFVDNGADTFVSLKYCDATDGGIIVSVYPCAAGYASPEPAEVIANKNVIATPTGIRINGTVLAWDAVVGADRYEVQIGTALYQTNTNSLDISSAINWKEGVEYAISVRAIGKTSSVFSDPVKAYYNAFSAPLVYAKGELSWTSVIGATAYEIQVNGGEIFTVSANRTSAPVTLTQNGTNTVRIRFLVASVYSDWTTVEVKAYTVTFDTLGGSDIPALYKAEGDTVTLPKNSEKAGYTFVAWYNIPGGPNANGMAYGDSLVIGAESVTVYAYYTPKKYTVTYNYGAHGTGDRQTDEVLFESHYQLIVPTTPSSIVAFGGWFTGPSGTGTQLTDAQGNSLAPWPVAENCEVFAYWISETLTFVPTKIGGRDVYMVMAGPRIALLEEVTIPAIYEGLPVAMIAGNAFANCTNLKVLNIPATLEQISIVDPFAGCSNLEAVNVYTVEGSAQGHFWSSDGVLFDNGTGDVAEAKLVFMPMGKTGEYVIPDGITVIPEGAFANSLLSKITIPASVTLIGQKAFDSCKNLTSVVFVASEGAEPLTIGNNAFNDCTALESITLPARLHSIALGKYTLQLVDSDGNPNASVTTENAPHAFSGCTALTSIAIASGNKVYKAVDGVIYSADGSTLIYCPTTKSGVFNVPAGTQTVAAGAFVGCHSISEVVLPATLKLVGEAAFAGLSAGFAKVTLKGNSFVSLAFDKYAFLSCEDLKTVVLEEGSHLSELGEGVFYGCTKLASITIPASMTVIGKEAFRNCTGLTSVTFDAGENALVFGEGVFYGCTNLKRISLPANVSEIPDVFLGCNALERVDVDPLNPHITDEDGVVFSKDMTELLYYPVAKSGDYTIPATVKTIASGAFANNVSIGNLTVYTTLEVIGERAFEKAKILKMVFVDHSELPAAASLVISDYAFYSTQFGTSTGSNTTDLILPDNTKSIGSYAFYRTYFNKFSWGSNIETISPYAFYQNTYIGRFSSVVFPESITEIGEYTFYGCTYLGRGGAVVFHDNLTRIGEYAFYGCNDTYFKAVTIPAGVREIGAYAFCNASKLATVTFAEGSQLSKIGAHAFDKTAIVEITIPASVSDIGAYAFANNNKLTTVIFAESENEATAPGLILGSEYVYEKTDVYGVTSIVVERGHVFGDGSVTNKMMKKVVLPARLVEIGEYTFFKAGVSGATVTLPQNSRLQIIGAHAFDQSLFGGVLVLPATVQNMDPITDSPVPSDRLAIGAYAFYRSKFTKITFAGGGTAPVTVGEYAFTGCTALTEITLPARLSNYLSYTGEVIEALQGGAKIFGAEGTVSEVCGKLSSIKVEASENALYAGIDGILYKTNGSVPTELVLCPVNNTAAVTIPATVTKIWDLAFYGCAGLPSVTFEGGTDDMVIGNKAFYGCSALVSVTLPDNVVSLGAQAFAGCSALTELTLSANLGTFSGAMVDGCNALTNVYVGNNNQGAHYLSIDGILYTADMSSLVFYPSKHNAEVFTVPGTVTVIGANTFAGSSFLKEVILSEGVVEIRDSAFASSSITKITVPSTVTLIGDNAFNACRSLSEVVFAGEGTAPLTIGNKAFYLTANLAQIAFPARLTSIGSEAFAQALVGGGGLSSVTFAENSQLLTVGDMAFSKTNLSRVNLPAGMQSMGNKVFYECESLISVSFGEGLETIGDQTFGYCVKLEEVNFPATMRTMGVNTFFAGTGNTAVCKNLKRVTFGTNSQLQSIPAGTFAYSGLVEIVIPASVREITFFDHEKRSVGSGVTGSGDIALGAFDNCQSLVSVTFAGDAECVKIGAFAFYQCSALANVEIAPSVSTIGTLAFYQCKALTHLTIPASCTNFGKQAFASCTALTSVLMHSKATALSESMFDGCTALASINIPETVSSIGAYCFRNTALVEITLPGSITDLSAAGIFYNCKSLVTVTIDSQATLLGADMFYACSRLKNVKLSDSIEALSSGTFENCTALATITIPARMHTVGSAFIDSGLAEYVVAEGNPYFVAIDGVLFDFGKTRIVAYPANKTSSSFTVPKEVTEIGSYTFENITALREILFEAGGTAELRILDNAFTGCTGISYIAFPERLVSIGKKAFYGCASLVSVVLPSTLEEIESNAFQNCKILEVGNFSGIPLALGQTTANGYVMYNAIYLYTALGGKLANGTVVPEGGKLLTIDENGIGTMRIGSELHFVAYVGTSSSVIVPDGVTHIGDELFSQNKNIVKVSLPDSLVWIGNKAFYKCTNLTSVNLPDSIEHIGDQAFYGSTAITSKNNLPASLKTIGERAFYECPILNTTLVMPVGVTQVGYRAFGKNALTTFYIRDPQQPAGYDSAWAWKSGTETHAAMWGFSGEEITYTFTEQVEAGQEATVYHTVVSNMPIQLPSAPTKDGFVFVKWVDADGNEVAGSYYSATKTTLYAVWMTQAEIDALNAGTARQYAIEAVNGATHTVVDNDTKANGTIWFKVTATEDVTLTVTTQSGFDTVIEIYIDESASYAVEYDENDGADEVITHTFEAGATYYIKAYMYSALKIGSLTVTVTAD